MFLLQLTKTLARHKLSYAIVGGYAVSLHGAVRGTLDIDLVIPQEESSYELAEVALNAIGLVCSLPVSAKEVFGFREEYIEKRNLTAWSFRNPADVSQIVDIIITHDLNDLSVQQVKVKQSSLTIVGIDDLIKMKQEAGRPQDLADIEALSKLR